MKKTFKLLWLAFLGWLGFQLIKGFKFLSTFGKVLCFGAISAPIEKKLLPHSSYALLFSALEFDLNNHKMIGEQATIKLFGRFSAFDLVVPENWKVELSGTSDKSDIANDSTCVDESAPRLFIEHDLKFSALNIHVEPKAEPQVDDFSKTE